MSRSTSAARVPDRFRLSGERAAWRHAYACGAAGLDMPHARSYPDPTRDGWRAGRGAFDRSRQLALPLGGAP